MSHAWVWARCVRGGWSPATAWLCSLLRASGPAGHLPSAHNNQPRDTSTYPASLMVNTLCLSSLWYSTHCISLVSDGQHIASLCSLLYQCILFSSTTTSPETLTHIQALCISAFWWSTTHCISLFSDGQHIASHCSLMVNTLHLSALCCIISMHLFPHTTSNPETPAHIQLMFSAYLLSGSQHTASLCSLLYRCI